jgi:hypothetical protein
VTTTFARTLDERLDAMPDLTPAVKEAVVAQRADLAAAEPPPGTDAETATAIDETIDASFVSGFRLAMVIGAVMALAGAVVAWVLVEGKDESGAPRPDLPAS